MKCLQLFILCASIARRGVSGVVSRYELESFDSVDIAENMLIGDGDTGLPEHLQGLWWMDGNPLPEEVFSFGASVWDADSRTAVIHGWDAGVWTWVDSPGGRRMYRTFTNLLKARLNFKFSEDLMHADITTGFQLFGISINTPPIVLSFTMSYEGDGLWLRDTSIWFGLDRGGYNLRQIVTGDGQPTDNFADFLATAPEKLLVSRRPRPKD